MTSASPEAGSGGPAGRILDREEAVRRYGRPRDFRLVFTNGCFDLLHAGHLESLYAARAAGDRLLVAVNGDASVRRLKGPGRPLAPARDRAYVLAGLRAVDAVVVFEEDTPEALVEALLPDVLVKGEDYRGQELAGARAVQEAGGEVRLVPLLPGRSTTEMMWRIRAGALTEEVGPATAAPPVPERILVATRNPHKLDEIRELLEGTSPELISLDQAGAGRLDEEDDLETAETFAGNALAKARHFHGRTGLLTLAEDSGLCVDALGGGPGVRTRRLAPEAWARRFGRDEANNRWLLERLRDVPPDERGAAFRCAAAVVGAGGWFVVEGEVRGRVADEVRGEGGFGYDPLFVLPDRGRTLGELPREVKQAVSHRSRALARLRPWLEAGVRGPEGL